MGAVSGSEEVAAGDGAGAPPFAGRALLAFLKTVVVLLGCLAAGCATAHGDELPPPLSEEQAPPEQKGWTKEQKFIAVNAACGAGVLAYGLKFWGYGGSAFEFHDEGWFGQDAENGGSDKLGHAYTGYVGALLLADIYEGFGYERSRADFLGAVSSMATMTGIELADGFSHYGFSWGDFVFDGLGVLAGYWRRRVPAIGRYVDYRVEYWPSDTMQHGHHSDIATDYSGFKYLLALKLDGFESLSHTPLGWAELQVGYYTKGFASGDGPYYDGKKRHVYVAIGLNLTRLFSKVGLRKFGQIFQYYQPRYTYIPYDWTLPQ
jgi:hypothetical protein